MASVTRGHNVARLVFPAGTPKLDVVMMAVLQHVRGPPVGWIQTRSALPFITGIHDAIHISLLFLGRLLLLGLLVGA